MASGEWEVVGKKSKPASRVAEKIDESKQSLSKGKLQSLVLYICSSKNLSLLGYR